MNLNLNFELGGITIKVTYYYMALSHKDWELPNSRIWLRGSASYGIKQILAERDKS